MEGAFGVQWAAFSSPSLLMNNLLKEFREFAMRGNVVDLAIGVIIGLPSGKSSRRL